MRFILCQPAIKRFEWELEVCLTRLKKLGIKDIVLLFTQYDDSVPSFLADKYDVEVHVYDDDRLDKSYIPSTKPYLWARYLQEDPGRENGVYFYLDSDVLLRQIPIVSPTKDTWYASDCEGYLGIDYVGNLLEPMCETIGVDPVMIREAKPIGGAQWVIKNPCYEYWKKVYEDSVKLYRFLKDSNADLQIWTAEMWAQLWNVYHFGRVVQKSTELDFCWPTDDIQRYQETNMLHNAGVIDDNQNLFFKGKYVNFTPFNERLTVNKRKASCEYVKAIEEVYALKYEALHYFEDLQDKNKEYHPGDRFPKPANKSISDERLRMLLSDQNNQKRPVIKVVE